MYIKILIIATSHSLMQVSACICVCVCGVWTGIRFLRIGVFRNSSKRTSVILRCNNPFDAEYTCRHPINMNVSSFRYRNVILGIAATAVGYYTVLTPHTIFLSKYRYMMGRHQVDEEVPLGSEIQQRIRKVTDDLKLPDDVRNVIKPFSTFGFDLLHAGTFNPKYGAILGIPANFTNTAEQLRANLQVKEEPIDWTRQDAKNLLNALILSESAQKFAIAREILQIQAKGPHFHSLSLALIIAVLWTSYNAIAYRFRLRRWNVMLCRMLYSTFTLFGAILWFGIKDYRSYRLDREKR